MRFWHSVRFRMVFAFILIVAPLVLFLIYNNLYATRIVRQQISVHYANLMSVQAEANDEILRSTLNFMIQLGTVSDSDIILLKTLPIDHADYTLAKVRLYNRLQLDTNYYKMIDTFFLYLVKDGNPLFATQNGSKSPELDALLRQYCSRLVDRELHNVDPWEVVSLPGGPNYLIKAVDMDFGMYGGALVEVDSLNKTLATFDVGPDGAVYVMDGRGNVLTSSTPSPPSVRDDGFRGAVLRMEEPSGSIRWKGKNYLVLTTKSRYSNLQYVIVTTEPYILKNLPFFQKMLYYWIPLLSVAVLSGYVLFLQRFMFRPLAGLVRGMRRLGDGRFEVRLPAEPEGSEFSIMATTFNRMAQQIEKLKIDVYEEQLRVQRAEYKHLQVQINPHFYTNTLNIIYNLAALQDFRSVQKLALHLAEYFRFLMRSNRTFVRLEDEIRHIEHYLEIQKLRYLGKLDYEIDVLPRHQACEMAPLLLQPFVENAVIHGFGRRPPDGTPFLIQVASRDDEREPGRIVAVAVRDNGPGFPPDMLAQLASGEYMKGSGEQHLGIWNILHRFRMLYGDEGGISFRNGEEGGAIVEIRLPLARTAMLDDPAAPEEIEDMEEDDDDAYHVGGGR